MSKVLQATKQHCKFCFEVLNAKLTKKNIPQFPSNLEDAKVPIFVTWRLHDELRGCIGTFSHQNLSTVLSKYALISALQDTRFDPISIAQLPNLSVAVSFLVNFIPNLGAYDWEVGKNGIILNLEKNGRQYSATFLPEVASDQGWDKKTTLEHLLLKAGCNSSFQTVQKEIKITSYQSSKAFLSYEDWQKCTGQK